MVKLLEHFPCNVFSFPSAHVVADWYAVGVDGGGVGGVGGVAGVLGVIGVLGDDGVVGVVNVFV